jgi:hypothetical protein
VLGRSLTIFENVYTNYRKCTHSMILVWLSRKPQDLGNIYRGKMCISFVSTEFIWNSFPVGKCLTKFSPATPRNTGFNLNCPLSSFYSNQKWKVLINFNRTPQHQILWNSLQRFWVDSCEQTGQTDVRSDFNRRSARLRVLLKLRPKKSERQCWLFGTKMEGSCRRGIWFITKSLDD